MVGVVTHTPNLQLAKLPENFRVWAQIMNNNLTLIDSAVGSFISLSGFTGVWANSTHYSPPQTVTDPSTALLWQCVVDHTSAAIPTTFTQDRTNHPTYWEAKASGGTGRGAWTGPGTVYNVNDYVSNGAQYAVCTANHTSTASFSADVASGYWSILIDASGYALSVSPTFTGDPKAPTPPLIDNDTSIATTAFVQGLLAITPPVGSAGGDLTGSYPNPTIVPNVTLGGTPSAATAIPGTNTAQLATTAFVTAAVPPGTVTMYAGGTAPTGWLLCDGASYAVAAYSALQAVIGYTFGGAGANFNVPDMRGRVVAGVDGGTGRLPGYVRGTAGGAYQNTYSIGVSGTVSVATGLFFLGLSASGTVAANSVGGLQFGGGGVATQSGDAVSVSVGNNVNFGSSGLNSMSGNNTISTVQPTIALNYIIKY